MALQNPAVANLRLVPLHHIGDFCDSEEPSPMHLDVGVIQLFHRVGDSYVHFAVKRLDGRWLNLKAVQVRSLPSAFPSARLRNDAYFFINGFYVDWSRAESRASYLNAAAVDLDCHDLTWTRAVAAVDRLLADGVIPPPSLVANSGRGAWLYWLLISDGNVLPPKAYPRQRQRLKAINRALGATIRTAEPLLKPDFGAVDIARGSRVAGSINLSTCRPVQYFANAGAQEGMRLYTLNELETALGIARAMPESFTELPGSSATTPARPRRPLARPRTAAEREADEQKRRRLLGERLADFEKLREARQGFRSGTRNRAVLVYATLLFGTDMLDIEVRRSVLRLAAECRPPLARHEVNTQIKSAKKNVDETGGRVKNLVLAGWLQVTRDEVNRLDLKHIRPDFQPKWQQRKGRDEARERRRVELLRLLAAWEKAGEKQPSLRKMALILTEAGHPCSRGTVRKDLVDIAQQTTMPVAA